MLATCLRCQDETRSRKIDFSETIPRQGFAHSYREKNYSKWCMPDRHGPNIKNQISINNWYNHASSRLDGKWMCMRIPDNSETGRYFETQHKLSYSPAQFVILKAYIMHGPKNIFVIGHAVGKIGRQKYSFHRPIIILVWKLYPISIVSLEMQLEVLNVILIWKSPEFLRKPSLSPVWLLFLEQWIGLCKISFLSWL